MELQVLVAEAARATWEERVERQADCVYIYPRLHLHADAKRAAVDDVDAIWDDEDVQQRQTSPPQSSKQTFAPHSVATAGLVQQNVPSSPAALSSSSLHHPFASSRPIFGP